MSGLYQGNREDHSERDDRYVETIMTPLRLCAQYKPAFGRMSADGVSLPEFHTIYGGDPLYRWIGLDSDFMYTAHKAAGAMTSIYRQLGTGCERLFVEVLKDTLDLTPGEVIWSYDVEKEGGGTGTLFLDARVAFNEIDDTQAKLRFSEWMGRVGNMLGFDPAARQLSGAVFEVRQGYKSADSKGQNADLRSFVRAYLEGYIPVLMLFSEQINGTVATRYRAASLLVLVGQINGPDTISTYSFCRDVIGYDIAAFFERNSPRLRAEFLDILRGLLSPQQ